MKKGFEEAISIAKDNVIKLIPNSKDVKLEGAIISSDNKFYEITLSYELSGAEIGSNAKTDTNSLWALAQLMKTRREEKVFFVNRDSGEFFGFRNAEKIE